MGLFKHQQDLIDKNPKYWGLWWGCRSGKTRTAIELGKKNSSKMLIVCTKSNKTDWQRQLNEWGGETIKSWKIITKEEMRRDWEKLVYEKYDGLILDEGHFWGGYKSQLFKNTCKYLAKTKPNCVYVLTATAYQSSPFNIFCYESLLGHNPSWSKYRYTYFFDMRMGNITIPKVKPSAKNDLAPILQKIGSVIKTEECLELPEKVYKTETFSNTLEQKKVLRELKDNPLCASHIVYFTKAHQVSGGTVKLPETNEIKTVKSDKLIRLKELVDQHPKLLIVARYNAEIELIAQEFRDKHNVWIMNGKTPGEERQKLIDQANKADSGLFVVNAACSEGWNMPGMSVMVFYSSGFSYKDRHQMEGRILLQDRKNFSLYIDLVNTDSPDVAVKAALDRKEDFSLVLYSKQYATT